MINIKQCHTVGLQGTDCLGMKVFCDTHKEILTNDMTGYVLKTETVGLTKVKKGR